MMTTKDKLIQLLLDRGMSINYAEEALEKAKPKIESAAGRIAWNRPADKYPNGMYEIMLMIIISQENPNETQNRSRQRVSVTS